MFGASSLSGIAAVKMTESLIFALLFAVVCVNSDADRRASNVLILYHGVGENPTWIKCGQSPVQNSNVENVVTTSIPADSEGVSFEDSPHIRNTYKLRAVYSTSSGEKELISSIKTCMLLNNPTLVVVVTLDANGSVVAVNMMPRNGCTETRTTKKVIQFKLNFFFKYPENGPVPDTASYIQRLEREREAKERVGTTDNRSFIAKYWMYITPIVILLIISGSSNTEGNQPAR